MTLTFKPGESSIFFTVAVIDDSLPEIDETFTVGLSMPSGGARLGDQTTVTMEILTNDNAHGLIGFSNSSLSRVVSEVGSNVEVVLDVERTGGTFGLVRVQWQLSGSHTAGEITPASGQVDTASLCNIRST